MSFNRCKMEWEKEFCSRFPTRYCKKGYDKLEPTKQESHIRDKSFFFGAETPHCLSQKFSISNLKSGRWKKQPFISITLKWGTSNNFLRLFLPPLPVNGSAKYYIIKPPTLCRVLFKQKFITLTCPIQEMRGHGFLCLIHMETRTSNLISILIKPLGNDCKEKQVEAFSHIHRVSEERTKKTVSFYYLGGSRRWESRHRLLTTAASC